MTHLSIQKSEKIIDERKIKMTQINRDEALKHLKFGKIKKIKLNIKWKFSHTHLNGQKRF